MKVLLLGRGKISKEQSSCHACLTTEEYQYCIKLAHEEGQLITLDMNPTIKPDVIATVYTEPWADKVKDKFGDNFDIIIDEISCVPMNGDYYVLEAKKLLCIDGLFYGHLDGKKVKWFNTPQGIQLL